MNRSKLLIVAVTALCSVNVHGGMEVEIPQEDLERNVLAVATAWQLSRFDPQEQDAPSNVEPHKIRTYILLLRTGFSPILSDPAQWDWTRGASALAQSTCPRPAASYYNQPRASTSASPAPYQPPSPTEIRSATRLYSPAPTGSYAPQEGGRWMPKALAHALQWRQPGRYQPPTRHFPLRIRQ